MCVCGSSGSGKTELIRSMLTRPKLQNGSGGGIFQPNFDHIVYVYRYWQTVYDKIRQDLRETSNQTILHFFCVVNQQQQQIPTKNVFYQPPPKSDKDEDEDVVNRIVQFVAGVQKSGAQKCLLIFDDSCEEILESKSFSTLATAGRHQNLSVIFIKHNLYQQGKYSVTVDKNTTHILLTSSPRIGKQLSILGSELQCASSNFVEQCYRFCMQKPFGHLLIDLTTTCPDPLRFCTHITDEFISSYSSKATLYFFPPNISYQETFGDDSSSSSIFPSFTNLSDNYKAILNNQSRALLDEQ